MLSERIKMKYIGIGDNVVDRYVNKKVMFPGGNAVNFAVYTKKCGMDSAYLGVIADDPEGQLIRRALTELGVDISGCPQCQNCATEHCDVVLVDGDRTFVGSGWDQEKEHLTLKLSDKELDYLKGFDVIHCGCYADMEDEIRKLKDFESIRTFDFSSEPEYRTDQYLEKICPYIDIALFSGEQMGAAEADELQKKVRAYGTALVLITNGTKGQTLYDGTTAHTGMVKLIQPVDTMGAGDSFFSAFVAALTRGGWERGDLPDHKVIREAFEYAADFSAQNCLVDGSFGFSMRYE